MPAVTSKTAMGDHIESYTNVRSNLILCFDLFCILKDLKSLPTLEFLTSSYKGDDNMDLSDSESEEPRRYDKNIANLKVIRRKQQNKYTVVVLLFQLYSENNFNLIVIYSVYSNLLLI